MIKKYLEALQALFSAMMSSTGDFSFFDYLETIRLTMCLVGIMLLLFCMVTVTFFMPFKLYRSCVKTLYTARNNLYSFPGSSLDELKKLTNKIHIRTFLYITGVALLYLPVAVPTILYLMYLMFHV